MIIDRNIINDNISYDGYTKQDICNKINRWKRLLTYKYGMQRGDLVCVLLLDVNINHVACILAVAELGLKLFLANKPVCMETVHATKMAIYGPMDLTITDKYYFGEEWPEAHNVMVNRYSKQVCYSDEIDTLRTDEDVTINYTVDPSDIFLFGSTSGTTLTTSKPVFVKHGDAYSWHMTNALYCNRISEDSVIMNTLNLHHASALLAYLTPALQVVEEHHSFFVDHSNLEEFVDRLIEYNVDHTMVHVMYLDSVLRVIERRTDEFNKRVTFLVSGFPLPKEKYDLCKRAPVNFNSIYGSTELGGFLSNYVTDQSVFKENNLGQVVQDYTVEINDTGTYVTYHRRDDVARKVDDNIEYDGESYVFKGRIEPLPPYMPFDYRFLLNETFNDWTLIHREGMPILVIWDEHENIDFSKATINLRDLFHEIFYLKKQDFMDATKLSMEQVRAYVEKDL